MEEIRGSSIAYGDAKKNLLESYLMQGKGFVQRLDFRLCAGTLGLS